jgi:glycosyltransferase involved in cell wall biosynthesis
MEKAADRLLFVSPSDWLAETARRSRVLADARISVIPNPLAPNQVKPMSAETLTRRPISPSTIVFFTAAANISDPVKGIHFGVEAFSNAVEETDDALLLVAGAGKAPPTNDSRVVFLGPVGPAHMAGLLSRADYLLVTSLAENQPLLISDAQSHGVSLIARDSTGLTEHATIDPHAKLFRSEGELTDAIRFAKESRPPGAAREQLQKAAREIFSSSRVADEYLAVYEAALSS